MQEALMQRGINNQFLITGFTITLSHSEKAPEHDAHHFACGKENPMQQQP